MKGVVRQYSGGSAVEFIDTMILDRDEWKLGASANLPIERISAAEAHRLLVKLIESCDAKYGFDLHEPNLLFAYRTLVRYLAERVQDVSIVKKWVRHYDELYSRTRRPSPLPSIGEPGDGQIREAQSPIEKEDVERILWKSAIQGAAHLLCAKDVAPNGDEPIPRERAFVVFPVAKANSNVALVSRKSSDPTQRFGYRFVDREDGKVMLDPDPEAAPNEIGEVLYPKPVSPPPEVPAITKSDEPRGFLSIEDACTLLWGTDPGTVNRWLLNPLKKCGCRLLGTKDQGGKWQISDKAVHEFKMAHEPHRRLKNDEYDPPAEIVKKVGPESVEHVCFECNVRFMGKPPRPKCPNCKKSNTSRVKV